MEKKVVKQVEERFQLFILGLYCVIVVLFMHYFWNHFMVHGVVKPMGVITNLLQGIDDKLHTLERSSFYPWFISYAGYFCQSLLGGAVVVFLESLYKEIAAYIGSMIFDAFPVWAAPALSIPFSSNDHFFLVKIQIIEQPCYWFAYRSMSSVTA